jgi:hypothetical protein
MPIPMGADTGDAGDETSITTATPEPTASAATSGTTATETPSPTSTATSTTETPRRLRHPDADTRVVDERLE